MELKNLKTFVKVAELNNFTRAAEAIGYSQATVSAQIKELEDELGKPLFDRLGKKIRLTGEGKAFLPHAMEILHAEEKAFASVRQQELPKGDLTVITNSSLAAGRITEMALDYIRDYPDVRLAVRIADYEEIVYEKLEQGEVDFAFYIGRKDAYPNCITAWSTEEPIRFITNPENPILMKPQVTMDDILEEKLLVTDRDASYCQALEDRLAEEGVVINPALELGSVEGLLRIVRKGYGTAFVPLFMAQEDIDAGKLAVIDFDPGIKIYSHLTRNRNKWVNPQMRAFMAYFNPQ